MIRSGKKNNSAGKKNKLKNKPDNVEDTKNEEGSVGAASGALEEAGKIFPALSGLLSGLEKSAVFQEKLRQIDNEVARRLKETPLKRVGDRNPHLESGFSTRMLSKDEKQPIGKRISKRPTSPAPAPRTPIADVFEEKDHLRIIVELPGVSEKNVTATLTDDKLNIIIKSAGWKPTHIVVLPYAPKGKVKTVYKNGFLVIKAEKDKP